MDQKHIKLLREGGILQGDSIRLSIKATAQEGFWLCGTEAQVRSVLHDQVPFALGSLLETEEKIRYQFERDGAWIDVIVDLDGELGELPFRVKRALFVANSGFPAAEKTVPLQAQIEVDILRQKKAFKKVFRFFADGSFEMDVAS